MKSSQPLRECKNCGNTLFPFVGAFTAGLCLHCKLKCRHCSKKNGILANQQDWSEASKRSRSYEPNVEFFYYDEYYWCERCGAPGVYTAAQQKHEFETEKKYIYRYRKLCDSCWLQQRAHHNRKP